MRSKQVNRRSQQTSWPLRSDWLPHRHDQLVQAAGLPKIVLHKMRHGAVCLPLTAGMPVELVALVVGHAGGRDGITARAYAHTLKAPASAAAVAAADLTRSPDRAHSVHSHGKSEADANGGDATK